MSDLTEIQKAGVSRFEKEIHAFVSKWVISMYDMGMDVSQIFQELPNGFSPFIIGDTIIEELQRRLNR